MSFLDVDHAANELYLYCFNDGRWWERSYVPRCRRLAWAHDRGRYNRGRALQRMRGAVKEAGIKYRHEIDNSEPWFVLFPRDAREPVVEDLIDYFEEALHNGVPFW